MLIPPNSPFSYFNIHLISIAYFCNAQRIPRQKDIPGLGLISENTLLNLLSEYFYHLSVLPDSIAHSIALSRLVFHWKRAFFFPIRIVIISLFFGILKNFVAWCMGTKPFD